MLIRTMKKTLLIAYAILLTLPLLFGAQVSPGDVHAPTSNTAAVVTYAAVTGKSHNLEGVAWSYSAAPTGGNLKIEDSAGNTVFTIDITSAGAGFFPFRKRGTEGRVMTITLAAGGAGVTGKVSVLGHTTD